MTYPFKGNRSFRERDVQIEKFNETRSGWAYTILAKRTNSLTILRDQIIVVFIIRMTFHEMDILVSVRIVRFLP